MNKAICRIAILASIILLGACVQMPTESNIGYTWAPTISSCREGGKPNDKCVAEDLKRCTALVDSANPGRDESTYTGIITSLATLIGTAVTYSTAGIGGTALEAVSGTIIGSGIGTAITYKKVLYRASVEACMFSYGRDPKLTEHYFGLVKYDGKVKEFSTKPASTK